MIIADEELEEEEEEETIDDIGECAIDMLDEQKRMMTKGY
jgi:hypothetical protein